MTKSTNQTETIRYYYYEIEKRGARYAETSASIANGRDRAIVPELARYLERHHRVEQNVVELGGRTYSTSIFVAKNDNDSCYIVADSGRIPRDAIAIPKNEINWLSTYLSILKNLISFSEAMTPFERINLQAEFIQPGFDELDESNRFLETKTWNQIKQSQRLVLYGAPGAGKTTCLRSLALSMAEKALSSTDENNVIPVYIQLRHLQKNESPWEHALARLAEFAPERNFAAVKQLEAAGCLTLILDGIDEVPDSHRASLVASVLDVAERRPKCGILLSTRDGTLEHNIVPSSFRRFRLKPFREPQVLEWIVQRSGHESTGSWRLFISSLWQEKALLQLTQNPLALAVAANLYYCASILPQNCSTVLSEYVDALVHRWDFSRGVIRNTKVTTSPMRKTALLCIAAHHTSETGRTTFRESDFVRWMGDFVSPFPQGEELRVLAEHTGVIHPEYDAWAFSNSAVLAYLAARYLVERADDSLPKLHLSFKSEATNDIWMYACGITPDSTLLLQQAVEADCDEMTRVGGLLRSLAQEMILERTTLINVCNLIYQFLVMSLHDWSVCTTPHLVTDIKAQRSAIVWTTTLEKHLAPKERGTSSSTMEQLIRLIRALYQVRSTGAGSYLRTKLARSSEATLKQMSEFMEADGLPKLSLLGEVGETIQMQLSVEKLLPQFK